MRHRQQRRVFNFGIAGFGRQFGQNFFHVRRGLLWRIETLQHVFGTQVVMRRDPDDTEVFVGARGANRRVLEHPLFKHVLDADDHTANMRTFFRNPQIRAALRVVANAHGKLPFGGGQGADGLGQAKREKNGSKDAATDFHG
jgi:hypothetical protein